MGSIDRGLNLLDLDVTTIEEMNAFRKFYTERFGQPLPAFELWLENRPDVLKAYRLQAQQSHSAPWTALAMVHHYAIAGYEDGVLYEIRNSQAFGVTKTEVLECLAVAFLHAGPRGMRFVSTGAKEYLRTYEDLEHRTPFADNWAPDPEAFRADLDYSTVGMSTLDREHLFAWYQRTLGEVPTSVRFLAKHRPSVLKAYRRRWETAIKLLPKQMMPALMIQYNVSRGFRDGIREAALLGKAWGMTNVQIVDAVVWGMGYHGGLDSMYTASDAVSDLLD
jgi:hypothetical protein